MQSTDIFKSQFSKKLIDTAVRAGISVSDVKPDQLVAGYFIEKEHGGSKGDPDTDVTGDNMVTTLKIAVAHLREDPDYYTKLKKARL